MPSNCALRSIVYVVLVYLQLQLLPSVHCKTAATQESIDANRPPLIFPDEGFTHLQQPPPIVFPTDNAVKIVQVDVAPPPSVFPTNRADVIRAGARSTAAKEPPVVFPTDRSLFTIVEPTGDSINVTLANLKNRTLSLQRAANNPKDDAVRLEEKTPDLEENPLQPEEQYGSQSNNLMAVNSIALDDSLIVDRPHNTTSQTLLFSVFLTVSVLAVCMMLSMLVWRKYVQRKYGMRERLLTEEDGFITVTP